MHAAHFGPTGSVWASTTVHVAAPGLQPPYSLAYVDIDDGPRVLVHSGALLPIGSRVALTGSTDQGNLTAGLA